MMRQASKYGDRCIVHGIRQTRYLTTVNDIEVGVFCRSELVKAADVGTPR